MLLETEWVLRSIFGFDWAMIVKLLSSMISLPNVATENPVSTSNLLRLFSKGMDFADAMNVCSAPHCDEIPTFDKIFIRQAAKLGLQPPVCHP